MAGAARERRALRMKKEELEHLPEVPATVTVNTVFSVIHYGLARHFAEEAAKGRPPGVPQMGLPAASVIHAATALEAFIFEQYQFAAGAGAEMRSLVEELQDSRGLTLEAKWLLLPRLQGNALFDKSREPFDSFRLLVALRNAIVHSASKSLKHAQFPSRSLKGLAAKFSYNEDPRATWDTNVLTPACARWACNTAAAMVEEYFRLAGQRPIQTYRWTGFQPEAKTE